jgi:fatty-acyl-CoA synthase
MRNVLNLGQMLTAHPRLSPQRIGARDLERSMTFSQWNARACQLANALLGLGVDFRRELTRDFH